MNDLIQRLEAATGPDKKLDRSIWRDVHKLGFVEEKCFDVGDGDASYWLEWNDGTKVDLNLTGSVDAALVLVAKVLSSARMVMDTGDTSSSAYLLMPVDDSADTWKGLPGGPSKAPTLPISICIALLRAIDAQKKEAAA